MTLDSAVVAAWLSDVDTVLTVSRGNKPSAHTRKRKRTREAEFPPSPVYGRRPLRPNKRRALAPIENNMSAPPPPGPPKSPRSQSPAKPKRRATRATSAVIEEAGDGKPQSRRAMKTAGFATKEAEILGTQRDLRNQKQRKAPVLSPTPSTINFVNALSSPPFTTTMSSIAIDSASQISHPSSQRSRGSQQSGGRSGRPASPATKLRDMAFLNKPMLWLYPDKNTRAALRDHGLQQHWKELESICHDLGIVPRAIKDKLERTEHLFEHMLAPPPPPLPENVEDSDISIFEVDHEQSEYNALKSVVDVARTLSLDGAHESQWNTKVYEPLFALALAPFQNTFGSITVTTAKPIREFAPLFNEDTSDPKVVDFVICWKPDGDAQSRINSVLRTQNENLRTINQSLCNDKQPALISIETKRGHNDEDDAKYTLAMWMAAWQNSITRFTGPETRCAPLPGLLVFGHTWEMYWMLDSHGRIAIVKAPWTVGDTQTLVGCYRLLAVLRYLCRGWAEELFLPWFRERVLGVDSGG